MRIEEHNFFARDMVSDFPLAVKGKGSWIWDEKGKKYLDACAGANVVGIGHGVCEIGDAMAKQASEIAFIPPRSFLSKPSLELCKKLVEISPPGFNRVMLLSGGSEAMENSFRLSRQYHFLSGSVSKYRIISRWQGFHGNTTGTDAVSGHSSRRSLYTPMLMNVAHIVPACCYRCAFERKYPGCGIFCAKDLERTIIQEGPDYISAFVAETVVGAAGAAVTPVPEYYPLIREICDKYNILFVADEVMAGVGRTGTFTAIEQWGVTPDMIVLAKGLSSGYAPLAAILVHDKVFDVFKKTKQSYNGGHTYNAHPVTSSAGIAVLNYLKKNKIIEGVKEKGLLLEAGLKSITAKYPIVGDVRGIGLFWGMEFVKDKKTKEPFDASLAVFDKVIKVAVDNGLIVYPVFGCADGKRGDGILICPPLVIKNDEIEFLCNALDTTLDLVSKELDK